MQHLRVMPRAMLVAVMLGMIGFSAGAQQPAVPSLDAVGPQVGATVPPFSGQDQLGRTQTLASTLGPKGAMLVFFRSADW